MNELVDDFELFCDESEHRLLPNDRFMMFTPPCGPSHLENERFRLYYCPSDRPHRRAQYLGIYANKTVRAIGRVAKVIDCEIDLRASEVRTEGNTLLTESEEKRILEAARLAPSHGWNITSGHRFYLCDEWAASSYRKITPGGIPGARMLDLRKAFPRGIPSNLAEIAQDLSLATWT